MDGYNSHTSSTRLPTYGYCYHCNEQYELGVGAGCACMRRGRTFRTCLYCGEQYRDGELHVCKRRYGYEIGGLPMHSPTQKETSETKEKSTIQKLYAYRKSKNKDFKF